LSSLSKYIFTIQARPAAQKPKIAYLFGGIDTQNLFQYHKAPFFNVNWKC
jgi:hypothetical protein